jgi:hypothetical protein
VAPKPTLKPGLDVAALGLSPLESALLQQVDGERDAAAMAQATGLTVERVTELLQRLAGAGAVELEAQGAPEGAPADEALPEANGEADDEAAEAEEPEAGTHRKLFETTLHALELDVRVERARDCIDPELTALAFDPAAKVVQALLENPRFGLTQARLIALHHRNPVGLDALAARAGLAADGLVRRNLTRNPQLPVGLMRRLWAGRRMLEQWKLTISREAPEQTRRTARELLRQRFTSGPADERVELIFRTEGRCLTVLTGLPIDSKTTALLCGRTYASTLFIQNIARWAAAPPALIAHLLRQEAVRRSPMLRTLLQRHPNAPRGQT